MKNKEEKRDTFYWIIMIIFFIFMMIVLGSTATKNKERIDNSIEYMATIDKIYILNDDHPGKKDDRVYIVDTNRHVFELYFNPRLLLLDKGDSIILYIPEENKDDDVIFIDRYKQFGFVDPNKIEES